MFASNAPKKTYKSALEMDAQNTKDTTIKWA